MPEARQIVFTYKEIAEALVKQQGIHEGLWGIYIEFGTAGANVNTAPGADLVPAAIVTLAKMGLQRFDEEAPGLTVDAAVVNPAPSAEKA